MVHQAEAGDKNRFSVMLTGFIIPANLWWVQAMVYEMQDMVIQKII